MENIKIQQVAKAAGVSVATVSRVLNHKTNVRPDTREKVMEVIKQLDYHPNMLGLNLRQSSSGVVIVMANTISKPFYVDFMDTMQQAATENNYNILLGHYGNDQAKLSSYIRLLQGRLADGLILANHNQDIPYLEEMAAKYPLIQCCEHNPGTSIPYVSVDDYKCGQMGTEHLLANGRRRIAFLNYALEANFAKNYQQGFLDTMKKHKVQVRKEWMSSLSTMEFGAAYQEALKILSLDEKPDAFFGVIDLYAPAITKAAHTLGLRVPEDLCVISGDNSFLLDTTTPSITALDHRRRDMATAAFDLLLERIENHPIRHNSILIDPALIVRESTNLKGVNS